MNWLPLTGQWTTRNNVQRFEKGDHIRGGINITDQHLVDGRLTATLTFSGNGPLAEHAGSGGVLIGYSDRDNPYVVVQLGGWNCAYSIGTWNPHFGWYAVQSVGSIRQLRGGTPYRVDVRLRGQALCLHVNGVEVLTHRLGEPLAGSRVGLFAYEGQPPLPIDSELRVRPRRPRLFVAMPFSRDFKWVYRDVIKPVGEALRMKVIHMGKVARPGNVLEDMKRRICSATVVVADISGQNPNVYWEVGSAEILNVPVVLLHERKDPIRLPFDIQSNRVLFYDPGGSRLRRLRRRLRRSLKAVLKRRFA